MLKKLSWRQQRKYFKVYKMDGKMFFYEVKYMIKRK